MAATYTVKQVAEILGYSTNSIYTFLKENRIKGVRVGRGRFRIPQSELSRLLFIGKTEKTEATGQVNTASEQMSSGRLTELKPEPDVPATHFRTSKIHLPSLFDWFIGIGALLIGTSMFIFSRTYDEYYVEQYKVWLPTLRMIFIASGIGLLYIDISGGARTWWHRLFRLILIACFGSLSVVQGITGDIDNSVVFGSLALVITFDTLLTLHSAESITLYVFILGLLGPFALIIVPNDTHVLSFVQIFSAVNKNVLVIAIFAIEVCFAFLAWLTYSRQKAVYWVIMVLVGFCLFAFAFWYAGYLFWGRSLFFLMLSYVCFLIPVWQTLTLEHEDDRKVAYICLCIIASLFFLAVSMLKIIQDNMQLYASTNMTDKVAYARLQVESTLVNAEVSLSKAAEDPFFLEAITKGDKDTVLALSRIFIEINQVFQRLLVLDSRGDMITMYPYGDSPLSSNYSYRDYFINAATTKKIYRSIIFQANTDQKAQTMVLAVPVLDKGKQVRAVLVGSLDIQRLNYKLQAIASSALDEYFEVVDEKGRFIIIPDSRKVGQLAQSNNSVLKGLQGPLGTEVSYAEDGILVLAGYDRIVANSWGIAVKAPMTKVLSSFQTGATLILFLSIAALLVGIFYFLYSRKLQVRITRGVTVDEERNQITKDSDHPKDTS